MVENEDLASQQDSSSKSEETLSERLDVEDLSADQTISSEHPSPVDATMSLQQFAETMATDLGQLDKVTPMMSLRSDSNRWTTSLPTLLVKPRSITEPSEVKGEIDSDYQTQKLLGKGGMGTVHLAKQNSLGREVALKRLHEKNRSNSSVQDDFLLEATMTGRLEHPNIIPIYDVGCEENGDLFYVMKNIRGLPWTKTIDEQSLLENLEILLRVCDAIAFGHAQGILHRDLKPENIMIGEFGEVLVLDWGLAVALGDQETQIASPGGTPAYMAPELLNPPHAVCRQSDVYLLGAILFEILTGIPPHGGKSAKEALLAVAENVIQDYGRNKVAVEDASGELLAIATKAMSSDPADRQQSVLEFQQAIKEFRYHQESWVLSTRASQELKKATEDKDYTAYSRSVFGFEEALNLWSGNEAAQNELKNARSSYAECAEQQGDFDLALSLLDESDPEQKPLISRLHEARKERQARQGRLRRMKKSLVAAAAMIFLIVTLAAFWINQARIDAEIQRQAAVEARNETEKQRVAAVDARRESERQREEAVLARGQAVIAQKSAEENAYISDMRLVQMSWEQGKLNNARDLLDGDRHDKKFRDFEWAYWRQLTQVESATLIGHTGGLRSVAWSSDGKTLASAGSDRTVKLWDSTTGKEIHTLEGHTGSVTCLNFSRDGTLVASGSRDKTVRVWNVQSGEEELKFEGHTSLIQDVCFGPDGTWLVSGADDYSARIWRTDNGTELAQLSQSPGFISVAVSRDGRRLAGVFNTVVAATELVGSTPGPLRVLNKEDNLSGVIGSIDFDPSGGRLVSCHYDGMIKIWDTTAAKKLFSIPCYNANPTDAHYSPDGRWIASSHADHSVRIWDSITGEPLALLKGHDAPVTSVAFSPLGLRLASAGTDKTIKLWDLSFIDSIGSEDAQRDRKLSSGSVGKECIVLLGHTRTIQSIAFHPDAELGLVASAGMDSRINVWSAETGQEVLKITPGHVRSKPEKHVLCLAYSPDGTVLASGSLDHTVSFWDSDTGRQLGVLSGHTARIRDVIYHPDGQRLFSASDDGTIRIWDADSKETIRTLSGHSGPVLSVASSPGGMHIVSGGEDGTFRCWEVETGTELYRFELSSPVLDICYNHSGTQLAFSCQSGMVQVRDCLDGSLVRNLKGHEEAALAVAFHPDGRRLATSSQDKSVRLWDINTGQALFTLKAHRAGVRDLEFNASGDSLATAGHINVKIWETTSGLWRGSLSERARRHFIFKELAQILESKAPSEATASLRTLLSEAESEDPESFLTYQIKSALGVSLSRQGMTDEAEPLLLEGYLGIAAFQNGDQEVTFGRLRDCHSNPRDRENLLNAARKELESMLEEQPDNNWLRDTLTDHMVQMKKPIWTVLRAYHLESKHGAELRAEPDGSVFASGPNVAGEEYTLHVEPPQIDVRSLRLEVLADSRLASQGPGRNNLFMLTAIELETLDPDDPTTREQISFSEGVDSLHDWGATRGSITYAILEQPSNSPRGWAFGWEGRRNCEWAIVDVAKSESSTVDLELRLTLKHAGNALRNLGRFRVSVSDTEDSVPFAGDLALIETRDLSGASALAMAYYSYGEYGRARDWIEKSLTSEPESVSRYCLAALIYLRLHQIEKFQENWQLHTDLVFRVRRRWDNAEYVDSELRLIARIREAITDLTVGDISLLRKIAPGLRASLLTDRLVIFTREERYAELEECAAALLEVAGNSYLHYYNAACGFSLASIATSDAKVERSTADPGSERARLMEASLDALRQAIATGWDDLEHIKADSDLEPLRSHPGYQELLESLSAP